MEGPAAIKESQVPVLAGLVPAGTTMQQVTFLSEPPPPRAEVFVTVDTSQRPFPEGLKQVNHAPTASSSLDQKVLEAMGKLRAPPPPSLRRMKTNLDDLAEAASARLDEKLKNNAAAGRAHWLVCGYCSEPFGSGEVLFQHWLDRHCQPDEGPGRTRCFQSDSLSLEQCRSCNMVFVKDTDRYSEHAAKCRQKTEEKKKRASTSGAKRKKASAKVDKKKASVSSSASSTSSNNAASSGSAVVSCGVCSVDVKTVTSFFLHWLEAHHQITEVLQEVWQCGQCRPNKLFPSSPRLSEHMAATHHFRGSVYQCAEEDCGGLAKYACKEDVEEHQRRVHLQSSCSTCLAPASHLSSHVREEHEARCELCGCQVFATSMREHLSRVHAFENVWSRSDNLSRITTVAEDDSSSKAPSAKQRKIASKKPQASPKEPPESHRNPDAAVAGTGGGGQKCSACGQHFTSEKLLEKHYFANHEFQCKFCDLKMDKDLYGDHLREHLASERKRTNTNMATASAGRTLPLS